MDKNNNDEDFLDLYKKVNNRRQEEIKYNTNTGQKSQKVTQNRSQQNYARSSTQSKTSVKNINKQQYRQVPKTSKNKKKTLSLKKMFNRVFKGKKRTRNTSQNNKITLTLKKLYGRVFKGVKGTRNKILALALAFAMLGSTAVAAVENYNDKYEKLIGVVQDIGDDKFENSAPAKIDWGDRKNITSKELTDGKYYEITPNSIVLIQEDNIRPGDKQNDVIIYTEDGIVEGKIEGKYLKESNYQLNKDAINEYKYMYKVLPEIGVNLRSSPNLLEDNTNRVMGITGGEYVLGAVPEITNGNKYPWVKVLYVNEHGINEGYIREDLLERVDKGYDKEKNEESLDGIVMEVDTTHHGGIDLKCRSSAEITNYNVIEKIPTGEYVYLTGEKKISEARNWVEITYQNEKGDKVKGWVDGSYLKDVVEKQMKVTTDSIDGISLEIKQKPSEKSDSILKLENGFIINITQNDWESKVVRNDQEWLKVNIDGKIGYVESKYLEEVIPMKEEQDHYMPNIQSNELRNLINNISLNNQGRVTGIDSLGITANEIELLNNNGIAENRVYSDALRENIDISNINGDVNFMYFRIGATGYGKSFSIIDNTHYIEQVKKCEELGIPYGFYYYSTAINEEEAAKEFEYIEKAFDSLGELEYNLLPFAVDVELAANPRNDRQYGKDVTTAKAYLTNCLKDDLGVDVMLYTAGSCTLSTTQEANVLDLEKYHRLTGVEDVWMPMPLRSTGNISGAYQDYLSKFPKSMNLVMKQEVLDMKSSGTPVDLNTISKNDLIRWLERALEKIEEKEDGTKNQTQIEADDYEFE